MALNISAVSIHPTTTTTTTTKLASPFVIPRQNHFFKFFSSSTNHSSSSSSSGQSFKALAQTEGSEGGVTEKEPPESFSSARTQLGLLEQLTAGTGSSLDGPGYESDGISPKLTIREQLAQFIGDREGEFSIPLGKKNLKKLSEKFLTISQRRNIRRQAYLDEVSQRNDSVFFATIGAFVILPPVIILGIAISTGYVQLFP